ncbi:MAG: hypothetical protein AB1816_08615 [Bacillota bacterium]
MLDILYQCLRIVASVACLLCLCEAFRSRERLDRLQWLVAATLLAVMAR